MTPRAPIAAAAAVAAAVAAVAGAAAPVARADHGEVPVRKGMSVLRDASLLYTSVVFADLFDPALARKLDDGFTMTIAMRIVVYERGREEPVSLTVRTVKIRKDLWDGTYDVKASDYRGVTGFKTADKADVIEFAAVLDLFVVAPLALIDPARVYFVALRVEVNPLSKEVLEEYTRWITRPGGARPSGGSRSFFGSFVSLFVNPRAEEAERILVFRSILFRVESSK